MRCCVLHAANDLRIEQWDDTGLNAHQVRVKFGAGGICGSDLHYYFEGRVGDFDVQQPFVLGHEMAGDVVEVGSAVSQVRVGERVAVNPSSPCGHCRFCQMGRHNHCEQMRFLGSASVMPHVQGAFQELFVTDEAQCVVVPDSVSYSTAAFAEPLSVALHAVAQAGDVFGRNVLVTGSGPIGALIVMAARLAGARSIVVTDLVDAALDKSREVGATQTVNLTSQAERLAPYKAGKGHFDVAIEASGAPPALADCIACTRAGGRVVQVGMMPPGDVGVTMNRIMAKEISLVGSFRFHEEFHWAVQYLVGGTLDISPLLTATYHVDDVDAAFHAAIDREHNMKVHIHF